MCWVFELVADRLQGRRDGWMVSTLTLTLHPKDVPLKAT